MVFNFLFNKFEIKTDALIDKMIEIRKIFLTQNKDSLFNKDYDTARIIIDSHSMKDRGITFNILQQMHILCQQTSNCVPPTSYLYKI